MPGIKITSNAAAYKFDFGDYAASIGHSKSILWKQSIVKAQYFSKYIEVTLTTGETFKVAHALVPGDPSVMVIDKVNNLPLGPIPTLSDLLDLLWSITL